MTPTQPEREQLSWTTDETGERVVEQPMPQIVWAARPDGVHDYYNRRWYELTGHDEGVSGDASWADVIHSNDHAEVLARWQLAIQTGDAYEMAYRLKMKTGDYRWYLRRAIPVRDADGNATRWFGTITDVDRRKRTENQRRASALLLAQSNQLEDVTSVVSQVLQESLRRVHSVLACLSDGKSATLTSEELDSLIRIQRAMRQMKALVCDLLEVART